jgi:hypothetical protein
MGFGWKKTGFGQKPKLKLLAKMQNWGNFPSLGKDSSGSKVIFSSAKVSINLLHNPFKFISATPGHSFIWHNTL